MPDSDEARGLLALMLLQHARRAARVVDGELVTLEDQDRSRWDTDAISEALSLRRRPGIERGPTASRPTSPPSTPPRSTPRSTDWLRIVALYDELMAIHPSPVVALNRAVAVGMSDGPLAGLRGARRRRRRTSPDSTSSRRPVASCSPGPDASPRRTPSSTAPSPSPRPTPSGVSSPAGVTNSPSGRLAVQSTSRRPDLHASATAAYHGPFDAGPR